MLLSTAYFFKVILLPKYNSEVILKSKFIKIDQLKASIDKINSYLEKDSSLNENKEQFHLFEKANILKFDISELNADPRDKEEKFRLYKLVTIHSKYPNKNIEQITDIVINDIRKDFENENEIKENILILKASISDIDSLIQIAFKAGRSMENRLGSNTQTIMLTDIYKGINEIIQQRDGYMRTLNFYSSENLLFKTSPINITQKISFPIIILFIGFAFWLFLSLSYVFVLIIFDDNIN